VGSLKQAQLQAAAAKSNEALAQLAPDIQWVESYVADNETFCVYLARDEALIRRHAELSGFPASKITPINKMIDPTTAT
jgi:Nickel responsive protein SCO4226-like